MTNALLLAGGLGTRLKPITDATPKCLVPINGRTLLSYWLDALCEAGVRDIRINTHHLPEPVREFISQENARGRYTITESYELELLGSAGTVTANRDLADGADAVLLIYADNLSEVDLTDLMRFHHSHDDPFTMMLFHAPDPSACGIVELDADQRVIAFEEKPAQPRSDLANAGVYVASGDAYREIADMGAFDLGHDVLPRFVGRTHGYVLEGYHRDIGTHEALADAESVAPSLFASSRGSKG